MSEHVVNLNVERKTLLCHLFVCNNDSNGTTQRKVVPFCEAPMRDCLGRKVPRLR